VVRALADRENVERAKREADLSALRQEALANKQRLLDIRQAWTNAIYGNALSSSSRGARHAAQVKQEEQGEHDEAERVKRGGLRVGALAATEGDAAEVARRGRWRAWTPRATCPTDT
jgi:hypothetical protein